jgi:hypothetical protein
VNESGSKPEGTGPPVGCEPATVLPETAWVVGTEVEETVLLGTVVVEAALADGAVLVGGLVVVVATEPAPELGTVGAVAVVVGAALLPPFTLPQPATMSPADSNTAGQ